MKCFNKKIIFCFFILINACFFTCYNPVMETWWFDDEPPIVERGGVNFGVVVFNVNGGSPQLNPIRVLWDNTIPRIFAIEPPSAMYGFAGWLDEKGDLWDLYTRKVQQSDDVDGDGFITLTARWSLNFHTIEFEENLFNLNGTVATVQNQNNNPITVADQRIVYGGKVIEPAVIPRGDGQGLVGWFTQNGMVGGIDSGNWGRQWDFENDIVTGSLTLYARWSTYTRTVHLQVNGGTRPGPGIPPMEITRVNFTIFTGLGGASGGLIIDPGPIARTGFTFGGWYTDLSYTDEWNFTRRIYEIDAGTPGEAPFTLYARWVPNIYFVRFDADGGTPAPETQNIEHGSRAVRPPSISKPNFDFAGWYIPAKPAEWNFDFDLVTSSITLYAVWEVAAYTVVFHWGNPPVTPVPILPAKPADQRVTGRAIEPPPPVVREGHSFYRWDFSDSNPNTFPLGVNDPDFRATLNEWDFSRPVSDKAVGGVLNLYARWAAPEPDMAWVPKGSFIMGDAGVSGSPAILHAYPTRIVTLDGFYMNRYLTTQVAAAPLMHTGTGYLEIMGQNPSQFSGINTRPVERVSWFDAIEYCIKLTDWANLPVSSGGLGLSLTQVYTITYNSVTDTTPISGSVPAGARSITNATVTVNWSANGYRLPTEAEWEYAARGGHGSPGNFIYAGSNNADLVAWYNNTVNKPPAEGGTTQRIARLTPNAFGIFDMSGNLSEWCWDQLSSYKDISTQLINPRIGNTPINITEQRVRRGGGWSNAVGNVRSVVRNSDTPGTATWVNGFRVVRGRGEIW